MLAILRSTVGRSRRGAYRQFGSGVTEVLIRLVLTLVAVLVVMPVPADVVIKVIRIDGDLDHIHLVAVEIQHEQAHPIALWMNEDQRLLATILAGFANDALPTG